MRLVNTCDIGSHLRSRYKLKMKYNKREQTLSLARIDEGEEKANKKGSEDFEHWKISFEKVREVSDSRT